MLKNFCHFCREKPQMPTQTKLANTTKFNQKYVENIHIFRTIFGHFWLSKFDIKKARTYPQIFA
ncbi:hypothetical protein [Helicobacter sp. T3_23-1059]